MNIKVLTLIILCAVVIGADAAAQNRVYTVDRLISGGTVNIPDNSNVRFTRGGKIVNATVTGRNLTVEPSGTNPVFPARGRRGYAHQRHAPQGERCRLRQSLFQHRQGSADRQ